MAKFYQVGGSVRDELMGLKSKDIDYAVEAPSYDAMKEAILARGGEIFLETPQYLTIRAKVPNLGACDFVLCRKDGAYSDGRHPDTVEVGTIYDDLARRDFTVNAIAKGEDGTIVDPFGGRHDLEQRMLRCVGEARDRFTEDGLRMIRAIRFHITKGLNICNYIDDCLRNEPFFIPRLKGVSVERTYEELNKCFKHDTNKTFAVFDRYSSMRYWIFHTTPIWLKPTLEER